jgi:capsular polysaccharide biosynthesis protein
MPAFCCVPVPASSYLPPPLTCERLEQILPRFGGELTRRPGGNADVEYPLPEHATEELRDFLRPLAFAREEAGFLARLPGGRVLGSGNVLSPDGRSIARDVSPDFGKSFSEHWLLTYKKIRPPVVLDGTIAVIATTLGAGYCHWLLEELPRLLTLDDGCETIIAHAVQPFSRDALKLHGFRGRVLEPGRSSHFACEQLLIPSFNGEPGWPTREGLRRVVAFAGMLPGAVGRGERLYVSREKAGRRRVLNEATLWPSLQAQGFQKTYLEDLSWAEQIAAFRDAKIVVAPHGAGLANLAFCRPGTRVVEFFNRAYFNPCFWRLAALAGLDYRPVATSAPGPLTQDPRAGRLDLVADVQAILRAAA